MQIFVKTAMTVYIDRPRATYRGGTDSLRPGCRSRYAIATGRLQHPEVAQSPFLSNFVAIPRRTATTLSGCIESWRAPS